MSDIIELQKKVLNLLQSNKLDRDDLIAISATNGYLHACVSYKVKITDKDIKCIEQEILSFENQLTKNETKHSFIHKRR